MTEDGGKRAIGFGYDIVFCVEGEDGSEMSENEWMVFEFCVYHLKINMLCLCYLNW